MVPDGLWEIAKPLIPPSKVRPQGGGTQDTPDETLFAAIIYVLVRGCAWRQLPPCFGISKSTAHRRFLIWSRAGVWGRLHEAVLHQLDDAGLIDVTRVVLDTAHVRAERGRTHRPEPRGPRQAGFRDAHLVGRERAAPPRRRLGSQHSRQRRAEAHDRGSPTRHDPHNGRCSKPQRLHADKAYDLADQRRWLRWKRIGVRIARKGIESGERLGRRRWVIERTMSWLSGYRRLSPGYERHPRNYLAFLGLAAALGCYKRLVRLTT
nr:IS5 family transposase [Streptomyces caeruleatus]